MSRLNELPPDQRAALSLLLRQHKSYAEVAGMLSISEQAVRDRAHAALVLLAPARARALTPDQRTEVGDYLLRQQPVAERLRTRALFASSGPARALGQELTAELAPIADAGLPDIPAAAGAPGGDQPATGGIVTPSPPAPQRVGELRSTPAPATAGAGRGTFGTAAVGAPAAPSGSLRSSRRAGAVLLAVLAAVVIVAVVLISGGGSGSKKPSSASASSTTSSSSSAQPKLDNEIPLLAPGKHSKSIGVVDVVSKGSQLAFLIEARNLPAAKGFYYAVWLYNSPHDFRGLTKSSAVGANHTLGGLAALPSDAADYHEILLTKETTPNPERPGPVILHGPFKLYAATTTKH
jgi:Sigma-70, region 4